MLVDTNIFVDFLKGRSEAKTFFEQESALSTSVLVVMEVIAGLPRKADIQQLEEFLESAQVRVHAVTEEISDEGYRLFRDCFHRTHLGIADALIAATATLTKQRLATLNVKHFRLVEGLDVVKPY